jgi:hypothetical protein
MRNIIMYNLQLKYYNSNMFRLSSGHLQGVHINYMYKKRGFYIKIMLKLGFDVVKWLEGCSNCINLMKYSICSGSYKCIGFSMF